MLDVSQQYFVPMSSAGNSVPTGIRVALISSNFWPERTGIGQVTTELADFLSANGVQVSVATAAPYYPEWRIYDGYRGSIYKTEERGQVRIYRGWHYARQKPGTFARIFHEATLCLFGVPNMIRAMRDADVAYIVSPDLAFAFVAMLVARVKRVYKVLVVQDVMPDAAIDLGMLRNELLVRLSKAMAKSLYSSADVIYTLGEGMRHRIARLMSAPKRIEILPNTIDTKELDLGGEQGSAFREEFVPAGVFSVVHTGNMGEKQDLDLLLRTAKLLREDAGVRFYVFGDGAVKDAFLRKCADWALDNVHHFPFQPREMLPHLLHGADILLVSQRPEVVDIVVPSKLMTAMGAGAMIVAACPDKSETAQILRASGGGIVIPSSDEKALARAITAVRSGSEDVAQHRLRVRSYAKEKFDREQIYGRALCELKAFRELSRAG